MMWMARPERIVRLSIGKKNSMCSEPPWLLGEYTAPKAMVAGTKATPHSAVSKSNTQSGPVLCLLITIQQAAKAGAKRPSSRTSIHSRRESAIERIEWVIVPPLYCWRSILVVRNRGRACFIEGRNNYEDPMGADNAAYEDGQSRAPYLAPTSSSPYVAPTKALHTAYRAKLASACCQLVCRLLGTCVFQPHGDLSRSVRCHHASITSKS